jgi:D-alanine--poly(phosphoribitol) ligase subunit 1
MENGLVYYVGRADNMVKVDGYRVEMEEVERFLSQVSIVAKCAVAPVEEDQRVTMLAAYVVLKPGAKGGIQATIAIKREMAQWVQGYMIPQKIVFLDKLPYNSNNKIDRRLLCEMSKVK